MSFSSLPNEITENILARISRWNYPSLSLVSKRFHSIISSTELYKTRSQIGTTETCVYVCLQPFNNICRSWFTLCLRHNQTQNKPREKLISLKFEQNSRGNWEVPISSSSSHSPPKPSRFTVVVGSEIYQIGGPYNSSLSSSVRIFDCRSHTWRDAPNMNVARDDKVAVLLDEKIYVLGGCVIDKSVGFEVFDIKSQTWTVLGLPSDHESMDDLYDFSIVRVMEGKLYIEADKNDYTYEPKEGTWKVVREESKFYRYFKFLCVIDNVMCSYTYEGDCMWYDSKGREWKVIKGLEELCEHSTRGLTDGDVLQIVNHGGKLLIIWKSYTIGKKWKQTIWYAQIALETRCNGSEVWGMVEWVNVMYKVPCELIISLHCVAL